MTRVSDRDWFGPSTMLLVGAGLFLFPEPATSALGAGLLLLGAAWWFYRGNNASASGLAPEGEADT